MGCVGAKQTEHEKGEQSPGRGLVRESVKGFQSGEVGFKDLLKQVNHGKKFEDQNLVSMLEKIKGIVLSRIITDRPVTADYNLSETVLGQGFHRDQGPRALLGGFQHVAATA